MEKLHTQRKRLAGARFRYVLAIIAGIELRGYRFLVLKLYLRSYDEWGMSYEAWTAF